MEFVSFLVFLEFSINRKMIYYLPKEKKNWTKLAKSRGNDACLLLFVYLYAFTVFRWGDTFHFFKYPAEVQRIVIAYDLCNLSNVVLCVL